MNEDEWVEYEDGICYASENDYHEETLLHQQSEDEDVSEK